MAESLFKRIKPAMDKWQEEEEKRQEVQLVRLRPLIRAMLNEEEYDAETRRWKFTIPTVKDGTLNPRNDEDYEDVSYEDFARCIQVVVKELNKEEPNPDGELKVYADFSSFSHLYKGYITVYFAEPAKKLNDKVPEVKIVVFEEGKLPEVAPPGSCPRYINAVRSAELEDSIKRTKQHNDDTMKGYEGHLDRVKKNESEWAAFQDEHFTKPLAEMRKAKEEAKAVSEATDKQPETKEEEVKMEVVTVVPDEPVVVEATQQPLEVE